MKDTTSAVRRKLRAIVELRYPPVPGILDMRGALIDRVHSAVSHQLPRWRTDLGSIVFQDKLEMPKQEFMVSVSRAVVILEDAGTVEEVHNRTDRYFSLMHDALGGLPRKVSRLGVRFIAVYGPPRAMTFEELNKLVIDKFLNLPRDLSGQTTDSMLRVDHRNGFLQIGPIRAGEPWVQQMFRDYEANGPQEGVGLDIDSFSTDLEVANSDALIAAFHAVASLTLAVETRALQHLGFLDE